MGGRLSDDNFAQTWLDKRSSRERREFRNEHTMNYVYNHNAACTMPGRLCIVSADRKRTRVGDSKLTLCATKVHVLIKYSHVDGI